MLLTKLQNYLLIVHFINVLETEITIKARSYESYLECHPLSVKHRKALVMKKMPIIMNYTTALPYTLYVIVLLHFF